jgi:glycosyltransferase involved in cell wall biosynthesis
MRRHRMLFVSANETAPWGASEELWSQSASFLLKEGHDVSVSVRRWPVVPARVRALGAAGARVFRRREDEGAPARPAFELPWSERRASTLDAGPWDMVLISQGDNIEGLGWMEACRSRHLAYLTVSHSAAEWEWPNDPVARRLARGYLGAERCYFVSRANLLLTQRQLAVDLPNARIVRCPYHVPFDDPPPWPADSAHLSLALVARLDPASKGHDILFDVLRQPRWRRRPLSVTLYGEGPCRNLLQRLCRSWSLPNVRFAGFVRDIRALWSRHHALVLPSRCEGLPAVIVEAMLSNRVSIVTDIAGNCELLVKGRHAFVAQAPTTECFAAAMEDAWRHRGSWERMGRDAGRHARRQLGPGDPSEDFARRILAVAPHGS